MRSELNVSPLFTTCKKNYIVYEMKKRRTFWTFLAACVAATACVVSPAHSQNLDVNFDFSTFRYDTSKSFMELYYNFSLAGLKLVKSDSLYVDSLMFNIKLEETGSDSNALGQSWAVPVAAHDTTAADLNQAFVGQIGLAVRPGNYLMRVEATDHNNSISVDSVVGHITVPAYSFKKLQVSDIELCSNITEAGSGPHGIFYKNTYNVIPNAREVYGAGLPIIFYYAEVYNIPDSARDSVFTVESEVRDSFGQVLKSRTIRKRKFGDTSVEVGTVNGSDLKTGSYTFLLTIVDSVANEYARSSRRFFVYNPGLGAPENPGSSRLGASMLSTVFASMGLQEIDREFEEARYIATSREKEEFGQLHSLPAKRQFLFDFWQKRNPDPVMSTNKYRIDYLQRVAYANDHFRVGATPGWKTDRGRIYITYGKPDQVESHPNESSSKPYEIWYYNSIQGGVSFDFVDRTGFGDYTLVNSTARNEIHNGNWQQYLGTGY